MRSDRIRLLVETALTVALCAALNFWRIKLPWNIAGGDISLAMLPIFVLALRRGLVPAMIAGLVWGTLDFLYEPYAVAPIQVLLDYPVAFAAVGLAGVGSKAWRAAISAGAGVRAELVAVASVLLGGVGRFASHFVSGVVFFGQNAPAGQPVAVYSALYNVSYVGPSIVMCAVAVLILVPVLERALPATPASGGARA